MSMKIQDLFQRDIRRGINGVVKADQLDESSVWQELDEFVVTKELTGHLAKLVDVLHSTIGAGASAADKAGIWVSGFFGCGKSHLIKVLSYLLENEAHSFEGETRHAVDFFESKIEDALLFGELEQVVKHPTDTILFNIDSKANHGLGRDALLQVFLKVLNEKQGYCGDYPHIADMERHLDEKDKLTTFHEAFARESGVSWTEERDSYSFYRDHIVAALAEALGQSEDSAAKWFDKDGEDFPVNIENFAKWVKAYLDQRGPKHRIMFLADEVGQFIGKNVQLMLNLQTITEKLGTVCEGRAWVVVTSQEDLDAVLGHLSGAKQHDFSKIQGRFDTRLSLSSANVDEVIKERLLHKADAAHAPLAAAYEGKHDILKNQLSFSRTGRSFATYEDVDDFVACYPFAAYQFDLVQMIFRSIRTAGATGQHLAEGERSTLDAFHSAAGQLRDAAIGELVPLYRFYPAIEEFLDSAVKSTISQASDSHVLEPFDATLLQVLFLIRYVDEMPGTVDNLVTLCVDQIDCDKLALRKQIEASLMRLEGETLVTRNGDLYAFLTNEEQDIGRQIKNESIASGAEERELGRLIFEELLKDKRKYTYSVTGRDFSYNRICDDQVIGQKTEGSLEVTFISPLGDRYAELSQDANCIMESSRDSGAVLIRLPEDAELGKELRVWLQTEQFVRNKNTQAMADSAKRILRDRQEENRSRKKRLASKVGEMMKGASFFASGQDRGQISYSDPLKAVEEALEYVIENAYPKMKFVLPPTNNPKQEIQSILRANDIEQLTLGLEEQDSAKRAIDDVRDYLRLSAERHRPVVLHNLVVDRGRHPYGWPDLEVVLIVARLAVLREIDLQLDGAQLPLDKAYDALTSSAKQRKVVLTMRESADGQLLKDARALGKELFAKQPPGSEDGLFQSLKANLASWDQDLQGYGALADTGNYPGRDAIQEARNALRKFVQETASIKFLQRFVEHRSDLLDLADDVRELQDFYKDQKATWESLRRSVDELRLNQMSIEADDQAGPAFARMQEILKHERPYGMLHEVAGLQHTAGEVNQRLITEARVPAVAAIEKVQASLVAELDKASADEALRKQAMGELYKLLQRAKTLSNIPQLSQLHSAADTAFDNALRAIEAAAKKKGDGKEAPKIKPRKTIEVRSLCDGGFLETEDQARAFLDKLSAAVLEAVKSARVQIK